MRQAMTKALARRPQVAVPPSSHLPIHHLKQWHVAAIGFLRSDSFSAALSSLRLLTKIMR